MSSEVVLSKRNWAEASDEAATVRITGWAQLGGRLLRGESLAREVLAQLRSGRSINDLADRLNGYFALVAEQGGTLMAATDHVRSIPLFYRESRAALRISDDVRSLCDAGHELDSDSVAEFATAGYVSGPYTMYAGVRAMQAGEWLSREREAGALETGRYYDYRCTYDRDDEGPDALQEFDDLFLACLGRTCEYFDGRQVALPLSGGLDSRLLATGLKRLGYDNVQCFAYGLSGNYEAARSRQVAETLSLPWVEIPYTVESLARDYHGADMHAFWDGAHDGMAMPCITEWPAVHRAVHDGIIDENAVFLSGQSGDFINGSHLRYLFFPDLCDDPTDVCSAIVSKHYSMWYDVLARPQVRRAVEGRVEEVIADLPAGSIEEHAARYEYWECQERQVKYVIGGARVFEDFGREWAMPLWDREVMDFFRPLSIGLKLKGYFYAKYLAAFDPYGVFRDDRPEARYDWRAEARRYHRKMNTPRRKLKRALRNLPGIAPVLHRRARIREHHHYYRYNPLGFPQIVGQEAYVHQDLGKRHAQSLWLRDVLQRQYGVDMAEL